MRSDLYVRYKKIEKGIEEKVVKYSERGYAINDIYGDMAKLIENEELINQIKDLYFILHQGTNPGFNFKDGMNILEERWNKMEGSIENLIVKIEAYKQVIESKLQGSRYNPEGVAEPSSDECNATSMESKIKEYSVWKPIVVKNGKNKLNMRKPDWAYKLKMNLVHQCGESKWSINGEVIQDEDLLLKCDDTVTLLHHVEKYDVWE